MNKHTTSTLVGAMIARLRHCPGVLWRWEARFKGAEFEGGCQFQGRPFISVAPGARLVVGEGVRLYSAVRASPLGCFQPCVLRAMASGARLVLGRGVGLSGAVVCAGVGIEIGEGTILGSGAMVLDNDFHLPEGEWNWASDSTVNARPVKIGRGVFIGARAMVLKGVSIGDRAVVGAGAVVTNDVPAHEVAVGNPARVLMAAK